MAIYHAHVSSGSRAGGQSGAAKVAYVLREGKYARRYDLVVSGHGNLPAWAGGDPRSLFAAADLHERANGRLFLEIEVALPNELAETQQHELVRSIAAAVTAPGLPFTYAIHAGRPKSSGEPANPHVHILISERVDDGVPRDAEQWFRRANSKRPELGGAAKHRGLKERSWVDDTRKLIAGLMNEHLDRARSPARVTSDSHATRITRALASGDVETAEYLRRHPPGIHLGPTVAALERDRFRQRKGEEPELSRAGEPTGRGDRNRAGAAAGARIRERVEFVATESSRARVELQRATEAVEAARSAGLSDEAILGIYEESESVGSGSGWGAVEAATASQAGRSRRAEAAAGKLGIDVEAVYRTATVRGVDRTAAVEQAASIFTSARSALLTDAQVWRIHGEAEASEEGSGWVAVAAASAARVERKQLAETGAEEAGITAGDIAAVYAAASSRDTDPVAALEEETAAQVAAEARRTALFGTPGGREAYVAALTERGGNGDSGELSGADIDRVLAVAEAAEHLGRVRALFEDEAGRTYYGTAIRELGDRYGMQQVAGAVTAAEGFVRRVGGLSDAGHAVLDAALGQGEELRVADLEVALERAEEQERKELARRREEQRWVELDRRAEELRASGRGARWLGEAEREVLAGADRRPTLDEWASVVGTAEQWLGAHLDGLETEIRKQADGAALLRELQSGRVGDRSSRLTLAEREDLIDSASRWLRAWERQEKLFAQRDGKRLYYGKLDELDPGWRDAGRVGIQHVEQALEHGEATLEGRARRAAALRERQLASRLGTLREHDVGEWLYAAKLDELAPGWRKAGGAALERREQAIEWAERQVVRMDHLRAHDATGFLAEVGPARVPSAVERAFDHAEARLAAREREAAERARLAALDQEIARRRDEVLRASPAAGDALLSEAGFGESREKRVAALAEVEHSLAEDFAQREQVLTAVAGAAFLEDARREVLGGDRVPATLGERGVVVAAAERNRAAAEERAARRQQVSDTPGGDARLRAAGWGEARSASARDQVLACVEQELSADFARREQQICSDEAGEAFLRRGRLEILEADREPETLAERGRVIERAEGLLQAAVGERLRQAAERRAARLTRLFAVAGGDAAFFTALDEHKPAWRQTGTRPADVDIALDRAEQDVDRRPPAGAEHEVVVAAERAFPDTPSAAWRQAGERFPESATPTRAMSQRLSDRARVRALAAERAEPPSSPALVQRVFEWLRATVEKLLDQLFPAVRKAPVVLPPVRRQPEVLMPVRTPPRVRTPQPDPLSMIVGRAEEQYPDASSSTWLRVKDQLFELDETLVGQKARAAADKLAHRARSREEFRIPPPPAADTDGIELIRKWLRECAREEIERLGLHHGSVAAPPRPARGHSRGSEPTPGEDYMPGR